MHSACHQVEEGTVRNSSRFAHSIIFFSTVKRASIRRQAIALSRFLSDSTPWTLESVAMRHPAIQIFIQSRVGLDPLNPFFDKNGGIL